MHSVNKNKTIHSHRATKKNNKLLNFANKVDVYLSKLQQQMQCAVYTSLCSHWFEKFRSRSHIHLDFLTFFRSSVHGARVLCFIERVLRSHSVAICWSAIVLLWAREERSWCEFVSGLKMSTICFSYNSFQLLFLLLEVFCLCCCRIRSILSYRFTKDAIILKSTLTFRVFFFFFS